MTSKRRSLSASLGSWCVQLVYTPRAPSARATPTAAPAPLPGTTRALLPAFGAAWLAVAAACYALAHFIGVPFGLRLLLTLLSGGLGVAYVARCASQPWKRLASAARWPLAAVLALFTLSLGWTQPFAALADGEPNIMAAAFIGFVALLSVLLIGARSGGRIVPVAAPLVPALSLFGLLCLVAVDGQVQASFLVFVGAALYLLCYDRYLRRVAPDLSSGVPDALPVLPRVRRGDAPAWAMQSVLVSSVWFALFLSGGAALYWPLQMLLPNLATPQWNREAGGEAGKTLDYAGGAPEMELRGGTHALSDRPQLRATIQQGEPSGVWRGRVYENYDQSRWSEYSPDATNYGNAPTQMRHPRSAFEFSSPDPLAPFLPRKPQLAARQGTVETVLETIEPLSNGPRVIYSAGMPLMWRRSLAPDASAFEGQSVYRVRSFVTQPNLRVLASAPGADLNAPALAPALRAELKRNLQLPAEKETRSLLRAIVYQVKHGALPTQTPDQRVRAVASYLTQNCLYSLQGPTVPPTRDATAFFLSESREGACDMFASSMALLLREMKVPARVATGYLQSDDPATQTSDDAGRAVYLLRERDAHAWVEYYVPQFGWLSFDPTQNTREAPPSTLPGQLAQMINASLLGLPPALLALPVLGLALIGAGLGWHNRKGRVARPNETERQRIESAYNSAVRALKSKVAHAPHLTPGEFEARVGRATLPAAAKQEFAALTHLYLAARYGPAPGAGREQVEACLSRFKTALKRGHQG